MREGQIHHASDVGVVCVRNEIAESMRPLAPFWTESKMVGLKDGFSQATAKCLDSADQPHQMAVASAPLATPEW